MYQVLLLDLYGTLITPLPEPQPFRQVLEVTPLEQGRRALSWALTPPGG